MQEARLYRRAARDYHLQVSLSRSPVNVLCLLSLPTFPAHFAALCFNFSASNLSMCSVLTLKSTSSTLRLSPFSSARLKVLKSKQVSASASSFSSLGGAGLGE